GTADLAGPNLAPPLGQPLPAGLTWWYDPSGFVVPVPVGWKALPEGPKAVLFTEPSGPGTLRARSWDRLAPDPVVAMTREEARANLRDYHRLRIEALPDDAATEWEYTFTGPAGAMHGIERGLVLGGHTYLIQWRVPAVAQLPQLRIGEPVADLPDEGQPAGRVGHAEQQCADRPRAAPATRPVPGDDDLCGAGERHLDPGR